MFREVGKYFLRSQNEETWVTFPHTDCTQVNKLHIFFSKNLKITTTNFLMFLSGTRFNQLTCR